MTGYVLVIDRAKPENWEIGKRHGLWAIRKHTPIPLGAGDDLFFWQAGLGLIAHATATTDSTPVAQAPYSFALTSNGGRLSR